MILSDDFQSTYGISVLLSILADITANKVFISYNLFTRNLILNFQSLAIKFEHFIDF